MERRGNEGGKGIKEYSGIVQDCCQGSVEGLWNASNLCKKRIRFDIQKI